MVIRREKLTARELKACLGHYDLGKVSKTIDFARGSRWAPKLIIQAERGKFLLKRRARGKDSAAKVAFTHQIQLALAEQNFPLPRLVGTREDNNSMLALGGSIYEMFEYVEGDDYDGSPEATRHAGCLLGLYHKLLEGFRSDYAPPKGSYHDAPTIQRAIRSTVSSLPLAGRPPAEVVTATISYLEETYRQCAEDAKSLGLDNWPEQIVHGDWHPGNMLFKDKHVVAVIDYDSARLQQRIIDVANGALQFSIIGGAGDPSSWPDHLDESRFEQFMRGYDAVNVVTKREIQAAPYLMCEAMIAEAALPIAATGSFGRIKGFPFLQMVESKVRWILSHHDRLCSVLAD